MVDVPRYLTTGGGFKDSFRYIWFIFYFFLS
jgi:hypothetical protein